MPATDTARVAANRSRGSTASPLILGAFLGVEATGACVNTEPSSAPPLVVCDALRPARALEPVEVRADLGELGLIRCSGVAISPQVVLTSSACLVLPPELSGFVPVVSNEVYLGPRSLFPSSPSYDTVCRPGADWSPIEDGTFVARLEEPVPLPMLDVVLGTGDEAAVTGVSKIFTSGSASRCSDDLAALVLNASLTTTFQSVRLAAPSVPGERVSIDGFETLRNAVVQTVTDDIGDETAPPRALSLSQQTCPSEHGAGVFSEETGALIGIVNFGIGTGCDDPDGRTIAVRLSAFQRLLLDAASSANESLHVEAGPVEPGPEGSDAMLGCMKPEH
jgi:hypothetical protein